MRLFDCHTHSDCSPDGYVPMKRMAAAALDAGLSALCVTDHCDFLSTDGASRTLSYDWAPVLAEYEEAAHLYGDRLTLRLGLEFGVPHLDDEAAHAVLNQPALDFVIGSIHNRSEARGGMDFYYLRYETEAACHTDLDDYFGSMTELAACGAYDVLGHVIYPWRYMEDRDGMHPSLARYEEQLRAIFRTVIQAGKGIELNTNRAKTLAEWRPVLALYRACGGEIITVGSDAHMPDSVGHGIAAAYDLLREMGFRHVALYEKRQPVFFPLD